MLINAISGKVFWLAFSTIFTFFGLTFDLLGALILAFELIGLKTIRDYNSRLQTIIESEDNVSFAA